MDIGVYLIVDTPSYTPKIMIIITSVMIITCYNVEGYNPQYDFDV